MKKGTEIYLNRAKKPGRVQQVFIYNGAKREIVDNVPAGNIIGIAGVKSYAGETISEKETEPFEQIKHIFDPVVTKAIEAKRPSDLPKLIEVLRQVGKEDPTVQIEINEETIDFIAKKRFEQESKRISKKQINFLRFLETPRKPNEVALHLNILKIPRDDVELFLSELQSRGLIEKTKDGLITTTMLWSKGSKYSG